MDFLPWADQRSLNEFLLGESGITIEELRVMGFAEFPYKLGNFDETGFATTSGKVELFSQTLDLLGLDPLPNYVPPTADAANGEEENQFPLVLLTGLREKTYHHSRFRDQAWARRVSPDPIVQIHPETAAVYNIDDAEWVSLQTAGTSTACRARAQLTENTPRGVVATGMGWWEPLSDDPDGCARNQHKWGHVIRRSVGPEQARPIAWTTLPHIACLTELSAGMLIPPRHI